jgi:hypothetical protein
MMLKSGRRVVFKDDEYLAESFNPLQHLKLVLFGGCLDAKAKGSFTEKANLIIR